MLRCIELHMAFAQHRLPQLKTSNIPATQLRITDIFFKCLLFGKGVAEL